LRLSRVPPIITEKNATKRSVMLILPCRISFAANQKLSLRNDGR
jgi:hypothetical protein